MFFDSLLFSGYISLRCLTSRQAAKRGFIPDANYEKKREIAEISSAKRLLEIYARDTSIDAEEDWR